MASERCRLWSFDFSEIKKLQHEDRWGKLANRLIDAARHLEAAGAEDIHQHMHRMAGAVQAAVSIPLLHIADATAEHVKAAGFQCVGLLGTKFAMEQSFYKGRLREKHGLDVIVPTESDRNTVHRIIYDEPDIGKCDSQFSADLQRRNRRLGRLRC